MRTADDKKKANANMRIGRILLMGISDYNGESSGLNSIVTKMRVIFNKHKVNVVLVAHVIVTETNTLDGTTRTHRRILTGGNKIASEIPSYFNEVWHFEAETGITGDEPAKFICHLKPTAKDFAGTSMQGMPDVIDFTNKLFYDELSKYMGGNNGTQNQTTESII